MFKRPHTIDKYQKRKLVLISILLLLHHIMVIRIMIDFITQYREADMDIRIYCGILLVFVMEMVWLTIYEYKIFYPKKPLEIEDHLVD